MEDASRLDDSGEGTLERPMRQPLPPPRYFIYIYLTIALRKYFLIVSKNMVMKNVFLSILGLILIARCETLEVVHLLMHQDLDQV